MRLPKTLDDAYDVIAEMDRRIKELERKVAEKQSLIERYIKSGGKDRGE